VRVQEVFFEHEQGDHRTEVVKTYDAALAREAFAEIDDAARDFLAEALHLADSYDPADIPDRANPEFADFLWEDLQENAREDGNVCSFFIVREVHAGVSQCLYVSPDFPSAEAFAKRKALPMS